MEYMREAIYGAKAYVKATKVEVLYLLTINKSFTSNQNNATKKIKEEQMRVLILVYQRDHHNQPLKRSQYLFKRGVEERSMCPLRLLSNSKIVRM